VNAPSGTWSVVDDRTFDALVINPGQNGNGGHGVKFAVVRDFDVAVAVAIELGGSVSSSVWTWGDSHANSPCGRAFSWADVTAAINSVQWINSD